MSKSPFYLWRKLSSAVWEDAWVERLTSVGDRLAITNLADRKSIRIEVFQLTRTQARALTKSFGGQVLLQKRDIPLQPKPKAPLKIRDKLVVVGSEQERELVSGGVRKPLLIPAGVAFGTGDHATTATCLRLLADVSASLQGHPWEMLDLGCGTGILAIAGRLLGAKSVQAGDFDPDAVRVARDNVRANGLAGVTATRIDVRQWKPARTWDVIVANMFSAVLIEAAPKISQACKPGGHLVFSGVMREQEAGVVAAFRKHGFEIPQIVRKGKWVTGRGIRAKN